jgi:hypothetical protein
MLQSLVESILDYGPRLVGWAFLKSVTFGRYQGARTEDTLHEGATGLAVIAIVSYAVYRYWS